LGGRGLGEDRPTYPLERTYYKKLMEIAARKKDVDLFKVMNGKIRYDENFTSLQKSAWEGWQLDLQELIFSSVCTDMGQQLMDMKDGSTMWKYLCDRYEGTANDQTKAMTKRQLYAQLESAKCKQNGKVEGHLNYMCRLKGRLKTVGMTVDDAVFSGMLVSSLPSNERFDRLRGFVDAGMDCVDTPEKVVAMAVTFDKANQADEQLHRSFGAKQSSSQQNKVGGGGGQGKGGNEKVSSKGQGKTRACFVCGSTDHLKANCPDKAKKHSGADGNEPKRTPRTNCTLRQDGDASPYVAQRDDEAVVEGVVTGMAMSTRQGESRGGDSGDDQVAEVAEHQEVGGQEAAAEAGSSWWYFDTASNSHVTGRRSHFVSFTEDTVTSRSVRGLSPSIISMIAGMGTVALVNEVDGEQVVMYIDDVFYVSEAEFGLFSPGLAHEQGFEFDYDQATRSFAISWEGRRVVVANPQDAAWGFQESHPPEGAVMGPGNGLLANYTIAEGVGTLQLWHERMGHICPQYLKTMVDKGLVQGMMLTQRQQDTCDACHLGKQKKKKHRKTLDRATKEPNQVVYADLLFPGKGNGSRFEAVLVVMDGYSRFVTVHMLKSKSSVVVNNHLKEYVLWAERQAGRMIRQVITYTVKQVVTDKGGEFVNEAMEAWYNSRGIEHIQVGPKSSQLNLCERTHQSLVEMTKAMMENAGLPRSLWSEAMRNAVYIKNRSYNKGTQGIPYEMFFGAKPDVHHIRKFGSLAYVHVPVTPGRRKYHSNAKLGYVLGYAENVVGCKVYFPDEHTAKFVSDLRVAEEVVYRDRHEVDAEDVDWLSLHFTTEEQDERNGTDNMDTEIITAAASVDNETYGDQSLGLEEGEDDALQENEGLQEGVEPVAEDHGRHFGGVAGCEQLREELRDEVVSGIPDDHPAKEEQDARGASEADQVIVEAPGAGEVDQVAGDLQSSRAEDTEAPGSGAEATDGDAAESVAGTCGSSVMEDDLEDAEDEGNDSDEDVTVASVFAEDESGMDTHIQSVSELEEDADEADPSDEGSSIPVETMDTSTMFAPVPCQTGKRTHRNETPSEAKRVEQGADKPEPKRTRTGLREYHERRRPRYLDDYVVNLTLSNARAKSKSRETGERCCAPSGENSFWWRRWKRWRP
jgi:transposase InsO family protein